MPGGSNFPGPPEALELYTDAVTASRGESVVKGAKNPYTSRNGSCCSWPLVASLGSCLEPPNTGNVSR